MTLISQGRNCAETRALRSAKNSADDLALNQPRKNCMSPVLLAEQKTSAGTRSAFNRKVDPMFLVDGYRSFLMAEDHLDLVKSACKTVLA